jgi:hypothetical protein
MKEAPNSTEAPDGESPPAARRSAGDRRILIATVLACVIIVALVAAFAVYKLGFDTVEKPAQPRIDLSSLFLRGTIGPARPRPVLANPALLLQEHLERLRAGDFKAAYGDLSAGLRKNTSLQEFTLSAKKNEPLFRDIESYSVTDAQVAGGSATVGGTVTYESGDKSRFTASLADEGGTWKINTLALVYQ